jgi:hypothetical protein
MSEWHCFIVIDGESAKQLMAAGPNDLVDHFIPEGLMVDKKDIKTCSFNKPPTAQDIDNGNFGTSLKDNYSRGY